MDKFSKLKIAARYFLLGLTEHDSRYLACVDALEFACEHHTGKRNSGEHEMIHQLGIFHYLRTFHRQIANPFVVYTLVFLHDVVEDKGVSLSEIELRFGEEIARKINLLSKEVSGKKKENYSLVPVFMDEDASVVKAGDRVNNVSSMIGVFKQARLERYVRETRDDFLPLMKFARRQFANQESIFENAKMVIELQLEIANRILSGEEIVSV